MRRRTALAALLAVLLQAFAPLLATAAPRSAVDHVELCTAQGVVTIEVEGEPPKTSPAPDHCPACVFPAFAGLPLLRAVSAPPAATREILPAPDLPSIGFTFPARALPRAPPQHS